ncbi:TIGR03084 family metal-binding protein [Nocardioides sp. SOB77]|uniref:TIGR03084 family metal-binding protein n=1 Tax=Nocardioides oceani TaxID=3058369 RepID=A0ABT8FF11_9ACTN|nr:TIGR03084 family metal-binding protein [Nocardioides oceani]MDN4173257.1 TIGR03084 family metal-binding protein [Nocardioides oceani]
MSLLDDLLADLRAEGDQLYAAVAGLDADGWATPTPAAGWTVATQVAHLVWTDEVAVLSARSATDGDPAWDELLQRAAVDPEGFVDDGAHEVARTEPAQLLGRWDAARGDLAAALTGLPAGTRMPWFGPPMSASSMATARYMETWAHSLDVHEALGRELEVTDRVRHVAHLGVRTRDFAFATRGLAAPTEDVRVQLTAPSGETWAWGAEDAAQSVTGSAADFCRLVTQRVHRDDTDLVAVGAEADRWLDVAQCFAGPPGEGRQPRG